MREAANRPEDPWPIDMQVGLMIAYCPSSLFTVGEVLLGRISVVDQAAQTCVVWSYQPKECGGNLVWRPVFLTEAGEPTWEDRQEHLTVSLSRKLIRCDVRLHEDGSLDRLSLARLERLGLSPHIPRSERETPFAAVLNFEEVVNHRKGADTPSPLQFLDREFAGNAESALWDARAGEGSLAYLVEEYGDSPEIRAAAARRRRKLAGAAVADLWCGDALFTEELHALGHPAVGMDIRSDRGGIDLHSVGAQTQLRRESRRGHLAGGQMGPQCKSFSMLQVLFNGSTRTAERPEGDGSNPSEVEGNVVAEFTSSWMGELDDGDQGCALETPWPAFMFKLPCFLKLLRSHPNFFIVTFDQCELGLRAIMPKEAKGFDDAFHRKRTCLLTNIPQMKRLSKFRCRGCHVHMPLEGSVRLSDGTWTLRSVAAQSYPRKMCRELAFAWSKFLGGPPIPSVRADSDVFEELADEDSNYGRKCNYCLQHTDLRLGHYRYLSRCLVANCTQFICSVCLAELDCRRGKCKEHVRPDTRKLLSAAATSHEHILLQQRYAQDCSLTFAEEACAAQFAPLEVELGLCLGCDEGLLFTRGSGVTHCLGCSHGEEALRAGTPRPRRLVPYRDAPAHHLGSGGTTVWKGPTCRHCNRVLIGEPSYCGGCREGPFHTACAMFHEERCGLSISAPQFDQRVPPVCAAEEGLHGFSATGEKDKMDQLWPDRTTSEYKEELVRRLTLAKDKFYAHLPEPGWLALCWWVRRYSEVFYIEGATPTSLKGFRFDVIVTPGDPVTAKPFCSGPDARKHMDYHLERHTRLGNITRGASPWCSPGFIVKEKGKEHGRMVVDYRALNRRTERGHFPMPNIWELLRSMSGGRWISAFDLNLGFHHMAVTERAAELLSFTVPQGQYLWNTLPMGPCNGPQTFQSAMTHIFESVPFSHEEHKVTVFIDDVAVRT